MPSTPADIEAALARAPACRRFVVETDRMAPMLDHHLSTIARRLRGEPHPCNQLSAARPSVIRPGSDRPLGARDRHAIAGVAVESR